MPPKLRFAFSTLTVLSPSSIVCYSCSLTSDTLRPRGLQPAKLLCPWDFLGENTGVGCHSLLQGIFLTQGSNLDLQHCKQIPYHLSHQGSPTNLYQHLTTQGIAHIQDFQNNAGKHQVEVTRRLFLSFMILNLNTSLYQDIQYQEISKAGTIPHWKISKMQSQKKFFSSHTMVSHN